MYEAAIVRRIDALAGECTPTVLLKLEPSNRLHSEPSSSLLTMHIFHFFDKNNSFDF
jgi:hypothetical protein